MRISKDQVALGDSVAKIGTLSAVTYVVADIVEMPGIPPHVRLLPEVLGESGMLISKSAVSDRRLWRRVSTSAR
jgi:hypothetical protein